MNEVKQMYNKKLQSLLKNRKDLSMSQDEDNTNFTRVVNISYALRGVQMVIILVCLSYLCGILWYLFCEGNLPDDINDSDQKYFIDHYGIEQMTNG